MVAYEAFKKIFDNAFIVMDSEIKDSSSLPELKKNEFEIDHKFIVELVHWFYENYDVDIFELYSDYYIKCRNSADDKIKQILCEE